MQFRLLVKFAYIFLAIALFACNKVTAETEITDFDNTIINTLPDSIIDAGIVTYSMTPNGQDGSYFSKALKANREFNFLRLKALDKKISNERINAAYSKAIHNYSLSLKKHEFRYREHIVMQNRAALKMIYGDYYGAISDYDFLLKKSTLKQQEFLVLMAYCYLKVGEVDKSEVIIETIVDKYLENQQKSENSKDQVDENKDNSGTKFILPDFDFKVDNTFLASAFYYSGIINYLKGNQEESCKNWSKASELNERVSLYAALDAIKIYCKQSYN